MVRFCAFLRIKRHAPLLVRVPVNSFEFQPCGRTTQAGYLSRLLRHGVSRYTTSSIHRLGRGLPGYLILFAPHAFEPQCQFRSSKPLSPLVFFLISTHFTATLEIPFTSILLKLGSIICSSWVKPRSFTSNLLSHLHSLYAQLFRITLATYVLPRLLAHSWP